MSKEVWRCLLASPLRLLTPHSEQAIDIPDVKLDGTDVPLDSNPNILTHDTMILSAFLSPTLLFVNPEVHLVIPERAQRASGD